jgi:NADH-quinone oxidoreductase subunit H
MNDLWWRYLLALLLWPGLAGGAVLCWFYLWMGRKVTARFQGRQGPPFYQPFFDFLKLLGKRTIVPRGVNPVLFYGLPLAALASIVFALALLPVPGSLVPSFAGDLILLLYLLEMPAFCTVLAGYASRSLYGQVSASREAVLLLGYNLPFLASVIALAIQAKSFQLEVIARQPFSVVHVIAALTFLLSVPGRLRTNPFSIPNAEQEILAGSMTEFNGLPLAMFELAHGLELVTMVGLFTVLFIPGLAGPLGFLIYLLIGVALVTLVTLLAVVTGRIQINRAFRFFWWWGALAALASFAAAILLRS